MKKKIATFACGCFWGPQKRFSELDGVIRAVSGYIGGHKEYPTYEEVCSGTTGHCEAVQIEYDPEVVSYEDFLNIFWEIHNPTKLSSKEQYRSAIFYHNPEQQQKANESKNSLENRLGGKVVTEILPAPTFYKAEEYHQDYYKKNR